MSKEKMFFSEQRKNTMSDVKYILDRMDNINLTTEQISNVASEYDARKQKVYIDFIEELIIEEKLKVSFDELF